MNDFTDAVAMAASLILGADPVLLQTVGLSLAVSLSAAVAAAALGLPLGALVALARFPGRGLVVMLLNACMGLPPVVVGLSIYLLLSRSGPLGSLGLLFTPAAMVVAQSILVLPLVAALARQSIADLWEEYGDLLHSLGCGPVASMPTLLWEARYRLATVFLAGFGRAIAEVGTVMIVGGNIAGVTRVMTTTIALETGRGNLPLAMALGLILILLGVAVNGALQAVGALAQRGGG